MGSESRKALTRLFPSLSTIKNGPGFFTKYKILAKSLRLAAIKLKGQ